MTLPRTPQHFDLNSRIHNALFCGPHFLSGDICAELRDNDEVVLSGVVGSYYQKQLAQESVRRVAGISRVRNELQVATPMRQPIPSTTDA